MESSGQILSGTLCSVSPNNNKMSAIKLGIYLGEKIQKIFPEIGDLYREGLTLSKLVQRFNIMDHFSVNFKVAESAVHRALKGYQGDLRNIETPQYPGLLSKEELIFYGKEHNRLSGIETATKMVKEKKGIFSFTKEQQEEVRRKSVFACGDVPYSQEEIDFIQELISQKKYQKGSLIKVDEIASQVNKIFHDGKNIRKPRSISKIVIRSNL
ncbi:MAG: hypothetical protein K9L98_02220 [Candidatus Pacebacteria bacterium]|nr:hypothetical protein [Candidatus Paceibacterota bacterium]MCF7862802.1 hypothetical protein [Candidatus Paceibacterota bacterium]